MRRWRRYGERKRETKISEGSNKPQSWWCWWILLQKAAVRKRRKEGERLRLEKSTPLLCLSGKCQSWREKGQEGSSLSAGRYHTHTDALIPVKSCSHYMAINIYMRTYRHAGCLDGWHVLNGWNNPRCPYDRPLMRHSTMVGWLHRYNTTNVTYADQALWPPNIMLEAMALSSTPAAVSAPRC